jgi:secreted PhoX family phosphatase
MKIIHLTFLLLSLVWMSSCSSEAQTNNDSNSVAVEKEKTTEKTDSVKDTVQVEKTISNNIKELSSFFSPVDSSFTHNTLIIPEGFTATVLFSEKKDMITRADGVKSPAKGNHDMLAFIPDSMDANKGQLFVSHETKYADPILGDGGGATIFDIVKGVDGLWAVTSDFHHIDFREIGNTDRNCGGTVGPNGMIYTCEEYMPKDNIAMYRDGKGHTKTDSVGNLDYWQNIGYVVEIDPKTRKATQKMIGMGRYFHEDLEFMDDNKTVYLSDDYEPAVFFKFVADTELDYSKGALYAFKQSEDGLSGSWLELPRDTTAMIRARDEALERGATMFMRHEWFARIGSKIYIGETGHDHTDWSNRFRQGGVASYTLNANHRQGNILEDYYGRVLVFDTETNQMKPLLEGGFSSDSTSVFSNPDCVSPAHIGGKDYLILHEDINKNTQGRVPAHTEAKKRYYNELYFLDLSIENPTVDDLMRFAVGPKFAEFTGGIMSPDGSTLFLNIQHPFRTSDAPYQQSVTVAITGWSK